MLALWIRRRGARRVDLLATVKRGSGGIVSSVSEGNLLNAKPPLVLCLARRVVGVEARWSGRI